MIQRTNKLLIGKDISRDAHLCVAGASAAAFTKTTGIEDGEVIVLDKNLSILAAGKTIADTDTIFICQGTGDTYDYTDEEGTAVSTVRKIILSDPIEGKLVKKFTGTSYDAKSEQIDTYTLTGLVPVVGTEYFVRIVYKDMNEHPGQFTQTYRIIATDALLATFVVAMNAKINAHSGRRVNCTTNTTTTLVLTGRAIPGCTTGTSDLEEFRMVEFESFLNYIDSDGNWAINTATAPSPVRTVADYGVGTWELIRDMEKRALPYLGVHNFTMFPVQVPTVRVVKDETYDMIVIEHDKSYVSPDNQYVKQAPLTTVLAIADNAAGPASNQAGDILAVLNPWMASCPGAFDNITI